MLKRLKAEIFGKVQLVMFRDNTKRRARILDLKGYVQNTGQDTVEVVAEGEEAKLAEFLSWLRKGPPLAKVSKVDSHWLDPTGEFKDFAIRYRNLIDRL